MHHVYYLAADESGRYLIWMERRVIYWGGGGGLIYWWSTLKRPGDTVEKLPG